MYRSDPALIQSCLDGDETAWNELIERYGRLVYSIPRRYGLCPADADDVFQNVFTIVFRRLPSLRDQTRLSAWLITTTHRECWRLGKLADSAAALDETVVDVSSPPAQEVLRWERQHVVHEALDQLDERCQALLKALFLDPDRPNYEEIAAQLGMAVGSVGPTRGRCFKKLETILVAMGAETLL
ncbi:MAG TPA: sigma-70 family RNA polymerase sigma factor [Chloroflexi bacterium]|nr:sigma-70 family RNA polymerase sigma factor [Chloroflexota bacterium]